MKYVPGASLFKILKEFGAQNEKVIRSYIFQLLMALSFCHQNKIVHRDIKTSNIFVDDLGTLKLSDFGFLKLALLTDHDFEEIVEPLIGSEMNTPPEWISL